MIAIFDNDGTICDSQEAEEYCFVTAVERVIGKPLPTHDWAAYEEPTSTAIIRALLAGDPEAQDKELQVEREYLRLLEEARPDFPGDFTPLPGAVQFIERLKEEKICSVAIATGCFAATAGFKLKCCGISLEDFPHATSSDTPRRREIIPLAAARAGYETSAVVYFGDAPWDVRVSGILGIPMIGIGRRIDHLKTLGITNVFSDYTDADAIIAVLHMLKVELERGRGAGGQGLVR
jgi:beta-phosphoglucomutase-like phosphatase (HAD superfamily)